MGQDGILRGVVNPAVLAPSRPEADYQSAAACQAATRARTSISVKWSHGGPLPEGLDRNEYDLAKAQAAALGISVAELIRRAVREVLPVEGEGAWMKYAGFVETGDARSSQSIDELVYGYHRLNPPP